MVTPRSIREVAMLQMPHCWGWKQPRDLCLCQLLFFLPIFAGLFGVVYPTPPPPSSFFIIVQ